jgi:hypothetical protein
MSYNNYVNIQYPSDGFVGVEIHDQTGATTLIRTVRAGSLTSLIIVAYISSAYLCDADGNQLGIPVQNGDNQFAPSFYVNTTNNENAIESMFLTFTAYGSNGVAIAVASQPIAVYARSFSDPIIEFYIPTWMHHGTVYAYVDVYNTWLNLGVPLGIERLFQFTITGCSPFPVTPPTTNSLNDLDNYYNVTLRIPKNVVLGNYSFYASANYLGASASQNASFPVVQLAGLNGDGVVNFKGIVIFASDCIAYYSSAHAYTGVIDFSDDGEINFKYITFFLHYITYWSD